MSDDLDTLRALAAGALAALDAAVVLMGATSFWLRANRDEASIRVLSPITPHICHALWKELGYGEGYAMYDEESYLPEKIKNKKYLT